MHVHVWARTHARTRAHTHTAAAAAEDQVALCFICRLLHYLLDLCVKDPLLALQREQEVGDSITVFDHQVMAVLVQAAEDSQS